IQDRQEAQSNCTTEAQVVSTEHGPRAGWLAPVELEPKQKQAREKQTARRASNKGCLFMSLDQYLQLLDWTGRQLRRDKPGVISSDLKPIMERLDCTVESWLDLVQNFRRRFRMEAGRPEAIAGVSTLRRNCRTAAHKS
ncbi:MAG: hypothetical protein WCK86_14255, partial [Planctomycetia bacterium]